MHIAFITQITMNAVQTMEDVLKTVRTLKVPTHAPAGLASHSTLMERHAQVRPFINAIWKICGS